VNLFNVCLNCIVVLYCCRVVRGDLDVFNKCADADDARRFQGTPARYFHISWMGSFWRVKCGNHVADGGPFGISAYASSALVGCNELV